MSPPHAKTRNPRNLNHRTPPVNPPPPSSSTQSFPTFNQETRNQSSPNMASRDESGLEGKRRKLDKGKGRFMEENQWRFDDEHETVVQEGVSRPMVREASKKATWAGLNRVRMTRDELTMVEKVMKYSIHGGRYYPQNWLSKIPSLEFFDQFLDFHDLYGLSRFSGPTYPIEVVQFYASVGIDKGNLHATINGVDITITPADLCSVFAIPHDGIEINPIKEWSNVKDDIKMIVKQYFDDDATDSSPILVSKLGASHKFFLNFIWNTMVPRRGGRDKVSSYEAILLYHWLEGRKVDVARLIFHRIIQASNTIRREKHCTTIDLPYGMWISRLLAEKGVVGSLSYGVESKDGMCDRVVKLMGLAFDGPDLVFAKGNEKGSEKVNEKSNGETSSSSLEAKLDGFMGSVMAKFDEQSKALAALANGQQGSSILETASVSGWMENIGKKMEVLEQEIKTIRNDVITHGQRLNFLFSQGGSLVMDGKAIRLDQATTIEATKALVLKVLSFERNLGSQGTLIRSCLDRLEALEFRTRPGYVNPNIIHHP